MQGSTTDYYHSLPSIPLHNAQAGAPRYVVVDDLSPRLNTSARNKTNPLTDPGSESNVDVELDSQQTTAHAGSEYVIASPPKCYSWSTRFLPKSIPRCMAIPLFCSGIAGRYLIDPDNYSLGIVVGSIAVTSFLYSLCTDRSEIKYHLGFGIPALGIGLFMGYAINNGWLTPCTDNCPTRHNFPDDPPGPP